MAKALPIIIDTDPGQDDAVAILLALASPELDVLGITAVAGNVPLELTQANARRICELAGRPDIKVFAGCDRPMTRDLVTAENVHGKTGLDGPSLPEASMPLQDQNGVDFIIDTVMNTEPGTIVLCVLGPMTNIATALQKQPEIAQRLQGIVAMGGGFFEGGNVTPAAEFNIYVDPEAADIIFKSGIPITLIPLDCTHKALTTAARIKLFRDMQNRTGPAVADMLEFFERFDQQKYGTEGGPLHDPCVIAWLLDSKLFHGRRVNVAIELQSELSLGMTVIDWWCVTDRPPNATVCNKVNADNFFKLLAERLSRLP